VEVKKKMNNSPPSKKRTTDDLGESSKRLKSNGHAAVAVSAEADKKMQRYFLNGKVVSREVYIQMARKLEKSVSKLKNRRQNRQNRRSNRHFN